jgi:hypothetical protein
LQIRASIYLETLHRYAVTPLRLCTFAPLCLYAITPS